MIKKAMEACKQKVPASTIQTPSRDLFRRFRTGPRAWRSVLSLYLSTLLLVACVTQNIQEGRFSIDAGARLAVLPLSNATEVPLAHERAGAILVSLLGQKGLQNLVVYPQKIPENPLEVTTSVSLEQALDWARRQNVRYALSGTVTEWRYKTGVDHEPAVGVMLQIHEMPSGRVVWTATGGRTGWGYQGLAAVGQAQIRDLLMNLAITRQSSATSN